MGTARSLPRSRALLFAALTPLLLLLGVEGALRAAGAVVLWRYQAKMERGVGPGELWAFGDSFTYGIGADRPATESWPAVAVRELRARGVPLQLRNHARPGFNSTEIVGALARELERGEPAVVAMLAGVNNTHWLGQSGQFCLEEAEGAASRVTTALADLRTYEVLRHVVLKLRPARDADRACVAIAAGFQELDEGRPDRALERFEAAASGGSGWAQVGIGLSLLRVGRHGEAVGALDEALAAGVAPPALGLARGFSLRAAGRAAEAWEVARDEHPGDLRAFATLLQGWLLYDEGRLDEALARFNALADPSPGDGELSSGGAAPYGLDGRGWTLLGSGDLEGAREAFEEALAIGGQLHITPHLLGWPHVGLALVAAEGGDLGDAHEQLEVACRDSSAAAVARAVGAWLAAQAGDRQRARELLGASRAVASTALADALEAKLGAGEPLGKPPVRPAVTISVQQWLDPADTRLVTADLVRAEALARGAGARFVVLTYPQPRAHPELAEAHAAAARQTGAVFVDPREAFEREFQALGSWEPLLIPDGHPTTRGYEIIGRLVADAITDEPTGRAPSPALRGDRLGAEAPP